MKDEDNKRRGGQRMRIIKIKMIKEEENKG